MSTRTPSWAARPTRPAPQAGTSRGPIPTRRSPPTRWAPRRSHNQQSALSSLASVLVSLNTTSIPPNGGLGSVDVNCPPGSVAVSGGAKFAFPSGDLTASTGSNIGWHEKEKKKGPVPKNVGVGALGRGGGGCPPLGHARRDVQLPHLDARQQALHLVRVERAGAEVLRGFRAARNPEGGHSGGGRARVASRHETGQERVAGAHRGDGFQGLDLGLVATPPRRLAEDRNAPGLPRDHGLRGAHLDQALQPQQEVVGLVELVPDRLLGLVQVRGDHPGARAQSGTHRLAVGVQQHRDPERLQLAGQTSVDARIDALRDAPGDNAERRALREVQQLLDESIHLAGGDVRSPLVDLRLLAGGGIDHGQVGARLVPDPGEVVEDRLLGELFEDPGPGGAAREPGGDHGSPEQLQGTGHVDSLSTRHRAPPHGGVRVAEPEARNRHGAVDRRVQGHGQDHDRSPSRSRTGSCSLGRIRSSCLGVRSSGPRPSRLAARRGAITPISITAAPIAINAAGSGRRARARSRNVASSAARADTRGTDPASRPSTLTVTSPSSSPRSIGPSTSSGALTDVSTCCPRRTGTRSSRSATSGRVPSSRAASPGAPSTTETRVVPFRVPEPTRTYPASSVWPVFTPFTHGTRSRELRLVTSRESLPVRNMALGVSTMRRKIGCLRNRSVSAARSAAVEWLRAESSPIGFSYSVPVRPSAPAVLFISRTNFGTEPDTPSASVTAASLALGSSSAYRRSRTDIRSPGESPARDSNGLLGW